MPKGRLASTPGMVEAAAIKPISGSDAPKLMANKVSVGLFDIVELKMANKPIPQRNRKGFEIRRMGFLTFFVILVFSYVVGLFGLVFRTG